MPTTQPPPGAKITYRRQYRRCGKPGCSVCGPGGQGHGPYWYAYWSEAGRMRSRYVGKEAPADTPRPAEPASKNSHGPDGPGAEAAEAAGCALRVRTLGGFAVWRGDEPIPAARWNRRKVSALFKLLLGAPGHRMHREALIDQLWPDAEPAEGAHSLRSTVHLLRQTLGGSRAASYVQSEGDWLLLLPVPDRAAAGDWLDAAAFERAAARALADRTPSACRAALSLYTGPYLPEEVYADWAVVRREALQGQYLAVLLLLADLAGADGDLQEAERSLRAVLGVDPCHEGAAQSLMALLAAAGRRSEALQLYQALAAALDADLGVEPGRDTAALAARLQAQEAMPRAADLAPAVATPRRPTNLPAPLTSFVGRKRERAALADSLNTEGRRLLTLVGPGGCGKTRLAMQIAADVLPRYPDGVWLVELAATPADQGSDPAAIARTVAGHLGLREQRAEGADITPVAALVAFLQPRRLLLVLDNCEHLVAACGRLADALLAGCPALQILATSREALGAAGESIWQVPPLDLPPEHTMLAPEEAGRFDAVALFVERARRSRPGFSLTARDAEAVVDICRRLDGIPLAIELATARLSLLTVETLAARLGDRFGLLTGGNRTALPRQQTLRATMDWSYALLTEPERTLLRRLSIFADGWSLEAAEAICADPATGDGSRPDEGPSIAGEGVLDLLFRLVAKSLVVASEAEGETRCRLLQTVHQYASEQLAEGEAATLRRRFVAWYLHLAERMEAEWERPEQSRWLARLEREHENLRRALAWLAGDSDGVARLRLATALRPFWEVRGHLREGRQQLEEAIAAGAGPVELRARALTGGGRLAELQGAYAEAEALYEQSLALWRQLGDRRGIANALIGRGVVMACQGQLARARSVWEESLALDRALGYARGMIVSLNNLGGAAYYEGDHATATTYFEESLGLSRRAGDKRSMALALNNLAEIARDGGDHRRAAALFRECLTLYGEFGDKQGAALSLEGMAGALVALGLAEPAARLCGAAEALRAASGAAGTPLDRAVYEQVRARVMAALGGERFTRAHAAGLAMSLDQAIAAALAAVEDPG